MRTHCFYIALALLLPACSPTGVAVPVERIEAPDTLAWLDVVSDAPNVILFEITNAGTADATIAVTAPEPFFVPTPTVPVAVGQTAQVRVGIEAPGFDPLAAQVVLTGPFSETRIPVTVEFDLDADEDGFIDLDAGGTDCDDRDANVSPAAPEVCDLVDNDCDGTADNNAVDVSIWYRDADGDGYGDPADSMAVCWRPSGYIARGGDCDDTDGGVHPGAEETWYDGVDQDCDGHSDYDRDYDGFDVNIHGGSDCRDTNANINPDADEIWYDGVDQNCDAASDFDQDGDGHDITGVAGGDDCADTLYDVHPGAFEADNGADDDCDTMVDETWLARGDLLFTELLVSPSARPAQDGQYVELVNHSERAIVLIGMTVTTSSGTGVLPDAVLAPDDVALLCGNTDPADNGGLDCDAALPAVLGTSDWIVIEAEDVLDEVDWTGWALPNGAAIELGAGGLDPDMNDLGNSWCTSTQDAGSGELGTPGVLDAPCASAN